MIENTGGDVVEIDAGTLMGDELTPLDDAGLGEQFGLDTDGDGYVETMAVDLDGDGMAETLQMDTDHDGFVDTVATDVDHDGVVDPEELSLVGEVDLAGDPSLVDPAGYVPGYNPGGSDVWDNFDPASGGNVIGDPGGQIDSWHVQEGGSSCAVVSQEFVLETVTGQDFSEADLVAEATEHGWFTDEGGTSPDDMGKVLELHGVGVDRSNGNDLDSIEQVLADGRQVMVALDSDEIWYPDESADGLLTDHFMPGMDANHAVQVIGVDRTDPDNPMVVLNDSGTPNGQGSMIPADVFLDAWSDSDHYMVQTTGGPPDSPVESFYAARAS